MMGREDLWYSILFVLSVLVSAISQVMLRESAIKQYNSKISEYMNPLVIGAYAIFLGATFLTMIAYRVVPLSWGPVIESSGYIFVGILSCLFLKEKINGRKLLGMVLIIGGIVVYSF